MNNRKSTSINDLYISEINETKHNFEDTLNKKTHDRPAIFIEELKDQEQYDSSIKNN